MLNIEAAKVRTIFCLKLSFIMGIMTHPCYSLCFKKMGRWTLVLPKKPGTPKPHQNTETICWLSAAQSTYRRTV